MLGRVEMTVVQLNGSSINVCNEIRAGLFVKCSHTLGTLWGCSPQVKMFFNVKNRISVSYRSIPWYSVFNSNFSFIDQFSDSNHGSRIAEIIAIYRTNGGLGTILVPPSPFPGFAFNIHMLHMWMLIAYTSHMNKTDFWVTNLVVALLFITTVKLRQISIDHCWSSIPTEPSYSRWYLT